MIEFGIGVTNLETLLIAVISAIVADLILVLISHFWKLISGLDIPAILVSPVVPRVLLSCAVLLLSLMEALISDLY